MSRRDKSSSPQLDAQNQAHQYSLYLHAAVIYALSHPGVERHTSNESSLQGKFRFPREGCERTYILLARVCHREVLKYTRRLHIATFSSIIKTAARESRRCANIISRGI